MCQRLPGEPAARTIVCPRGSFKCHHACSILEALAEHGEIENASATCVGGLGWGCEIGFDVEATRVPKAAAQECSQDLGLALGAGLPAEAPCCSRPGL